MLLLASGKYLASLYGKCMYHVCDIFSIKKLANSNLMQAYIEFLIQFGLTMSKLLMFLNQSRSIRVWIILSLKQRNSVCIGDTVNKCGAKRWHNYLYIHSTVGTFSI